MLKYSTASSSIDKKFAPYSSHVGKEMKSNQKTPQTKSAMSQIIYFFLFTVYIHM